MRWIEQLDQAKFSSAYDFDTYERANQRTFLLAASLIGLIPTLLFFILGMLRDRSLLIYLSIIPPLLLSSVVIFINVGKKIANGLFLLTLLASIFLYSLVLNDHGILFACIFPPAAFYLYGKRKGLLWILPIVLCYGLITGLILSQVVSSSVSDTLLFMGFALLLLVGLITYLMKAREEHIGFLMRSYIYYDPLTDLPNRALLLRAIAEAKSPALMLINIDDFKEINAIYGYRGGDQVLLCAAEKLEQILPVSAVGVYRLNADEFAVLIEKKEDVRFRRSLTNIANLITRFLRHEKCMYQDVEIRFRTSMGIAIAEEVGKKKLFASADIALKAAKGTNKSFLFYREALPTEKRYEENIKWANILTDALDNGRIIPFYQPIVENKSNSIVKYEVLVRLIDSKGQVISPYFFLDIAKKSRVYTRITKTLLRRATEFLLINTQGVSINLTVEDILDQSVTDYINKLFSENPTLQSRLCFEITESEGIENFDQVSGFITELKKQGCQVAIDDFGTGYSNFEYLTRLNVDILKIDGSLVKDMHRDVNSRLVVENIVSFTKKMGIQTVAEYVESEAVLSQVKKLGIDFSQGYFIGKPIPSVKAIERDELIEGAPG